MKMVYTQGRCLVTEDADVTKLVEGVDISGVSIAGLKCDAETVSKLYMRAQAESWKNGVIDTTLAGQYVKLRDKFVDYVYRRDTLGEKYLDAI